MFCQRHIVSFLRDDLLAEVSQQAALRLAGPAAGPCFASPGWLLLPSIAAVTASASPFSKKPVATAPRVHPSQPRVHVRGGGPTTADALRPVPDICWAPSPIRLLALVRGGGARRTTTVTQKVPKKSASPARPVKGAKQEAVAPPDYSSFLTGLKALNKEDLIKKVTALNAAATSGWVPRAIAFGELYNREGLAALPIADLLGHSTTKNESRGTGVTRGYSHGVPSRLREAVESLCNLNVLEFRRKGAAG